MTTVPRVTAVIVTYRSRSTIDAALAAAREARDSGLLTVRVVDNASADGTAAAIRESHPWVELIEAPENLGFARACNLGFETVATPYVLFLNPDAVLPTSALRTLVAFADTHPRAGVLAPAIRVGGDAWQHVGGLLTPSHVVRVAAAFGAPPPGYRVLEGGDEAVRTDWLSGAILLVRSELFRRLGGFDPRFFLYFEETDLCRRIAEAGWEIWAVGAARGEHAAGASARASGEALRNGMLRDHFYRSRFYYLRKHHGVVAAVVAELGEIGLLGARSLLHRIQGRGGQSLVAQRLSGPVLRLPARIAPRARLAGVETLR
jgi:GT2 family glycosyltransferase